MGMIDDAMKQWPLPEGFAAGVARLVSTPVDLDGARRLLAGSWHGKRQPESFGSVQAAEDARIYVVNADGTGSTLIACVVGPPDFGYGDTAWSPDGSTIAFWGDAGDFDIYTVETSHYWAGPGADRSELLVNRGADVRDVRPGVAEEDADVGLGMLGFPAARPLHDVHCRGLTRPLKHRGGDDSRFSCRGGRYVGAGHGEPQGTGGPLALEETVIVRIPLGHEREVGPAEKLLVLVPVQVKGRRDRHIGTHDLPEAPSDLGLGPGHVSYRHRPVQGQVDPVHRQCGA